MAKRGKSRSANAVLLSRTIRHAVLTERFKNTEARRILALLQREVLPDLMASLSARLETISTRGFDTGPAKTARLRFLFRDLENFAQSMSARILTEVEPRLERFAVAQSRQLSKELKAEVGSLASVVTPSASTIRAAVLQRPLEGIPLGDRWERRSRSFKNRVEAQVRIGLVQGETPQEITARVRSLFPRETRQAAMTARAGVAHAQMQARQVTFEENRDLLRGVLWVATLDLSTCPACGALDGKALPVDSGPRPPLHEGPCRCSLAPVLRSAADLGGTRASMDGQVPASVRYADWIEEQDEEEQEEAFGIGVADLFRTGRIGLEDMVDAAGNRLSLERLEALAGI